ncbi:HRAD17 [Lepeophtheirus salmonis]|uniref:HRAD17 n=1 Tax=Lepeophtheirus salmonis TaxID=72036 RepID=A0A7R8CEJ9_LEPSM|nr:HRAD17 [Lepeophtheirus salmonis]CAF2796746.1 HRAD17 [Lepeophtheirus salmonis]
MERTGSSSSWFQGDFDQDDEFLLSLDMDAASPSPATQNKARLTKGRKDSTVLGVGMAFGKRRKKEEDSRSWCDRYAPLSSADLAVQPKKVQELRSWIINACQSKTRSVLFLCGPTGSGKTACVRTLASEIQLNLREWEEKETLGSKMETFISFVRQASKYNSLLDSNTTTSQPSLVLIEETPSSIPKEDIEDTIIQFGGFHSPLILLRNEEVRDVDLLENLEAHKICLNPITNTNMVKALKKIASSESASGVRSFTMPDQATLLSLSESCKGDIRAAIHSLQFKCSHINQKSGELVIKKKKRSRGASSEVATIKDQKPKNDIKNPSLDLFHALGKVLYAKRLDELESFNVPHNSLRRKVLKSNPQDILDFSPLPYEVFSTFLHQNYLDFFQDIEQLSSASEYLSLSDAFFLWDLDAMSSKVQLKEFGGQLCVRGLLYHNLNTSKSFGGLKTFSKPEIYGVMKSVRSKGEKARSQFATRSLPSRELFTNFLPLLSNLAPSSRRPRMHSSSMDQVIVFNAT